MSEPEKFLQNFLERWSRRKLAPSERADEAPNAQSRETESAQPATPADASSDPAAATFDPASLPPIESITAASDVRAFLAPGVPIELTRAALRRAWVSDPTIRDFVGIAENQWDFTRADGVPGFGTLDLTPELRRMLAGLYGDAPAEAVARPNVGVAEIKQTPEKSGEMAAPDHPAKSLADVAAETPAGDPRVIQQAGDNDAAMQNDFVGDGPHQAPAHRRHGGALPK